MKICKKIIIIFLISIILLYSIIPSEIIYAEEGGTTSLGSSAEAGQIIANFARDMVENHASETIYDYGDYWTSIDMPINYGRLMAYQGKKLTGYAQGSDGTLKYAENRFFMDCVGFVSFCIHHSLNISGNSEGNFVTPNGIRSDYFEYVTDGTLQPGDILIRSGSHVMIYVDTDYVAEAQDVDTTWEVKRRNSWPSYDKVARIKGDKAQTIDTSGTKPSWDGTSASSSGGGIVIPNVDDTSAFDKYIDHSFSGTLDVNGKNNSSSFYYNGTPKKGQYLGKKEDKNWLFESLENASDWIVGYITMALRIPIVGWTSIFEGEINKIMSNITGDATSQERISVEDIIYNRVPILDVNLFNFDKAGGKTLKTSEQVGDKLIYDLRVKIAQNYVAIRNICIIILLFVLIYLGIRTALSTVARDKADYKEKLMAWVAGFIVVMCIHYFMIVVLNLNETALSWITPPTDNSASIYEQMRTYAYEVPAKKAWTGTILYAFLVYFLIKMLLFYFKRLLIVYILAIMSPILGISYAMQKIKGKSKALGIWGKEFVFNVIIQFVHAIIYTILMGIIVTTMSTVKVTQLIPYTVLLLILLNFVLEAEDIIKNIFKIESNSLKSILGTIFNFKDKFAEAFLVGGALYGLGKRVAVREYGIHLTKSLNNKYDKFKIQDDSEYAKSVNNEIERLKEQEKEHIHEMNSRAIDFAKNQFKGTVALVASVPGVFEKPVAGLIGLGYAANNLNSGLKNGEYSAKARNLENTTEGTEYIYIDNPNFDENNDDVENDNEGNNNGGNNNGGNNNGGNNNGGNGNGGNGNGGNNNGGSGNGGSGNGGNNNGGSGNGGNDNGGSGNGGNDNGGSDNGGNGNGGSDNGGSGNGGSDNGGSGNGGNGNGGSGNGENDNEGNDNGRSGNGGSGNGENDNEGSGNGGNDNGGNGNRENDNEENNNGESDNEENRNRKIRTYNTEKIKKYTAPKILLSWATVGRSNLIESVARDAIDESRLLKRVYSTRIEKLSIIGDSAVKQIAKINNELNEIKDENYPPIYYTPKQEETEAQIAINEKLREKYREILEHNIIQIYEGVNKDKISESIVNNTSRTNAKVQLRDVHNIAQDYLAENKCETGENFKKNLDDVLRQKILDTVENKDDGFDGIKLKPEIERDIRKAIRDNSEDKEKMNIEIDKIITEDIKNQVVSKISTRDLTDLISKTLEKRGSIEVHRDFKNLQAPIENLRLLNQEAEATSGRTVYSTEQLLDLIMNKDIT